MRAPIQLPFGGPGACFPIEALIRHVRLSGRDYIIQGQTHCALAEHPKPQSLDAWLRRNFTDRKDTAQAVESVMQALVSTGLFESGRFPCPDSRRKCKGIRLVVSSSQDHAPAHGVIAPTTPASMPEWIATAKNSLNVGRRRWEAVHREGNADIRRGLQTTTLAADNLRRIEYVQSVLDRPVWPAVWQDPIISQVGPLLAGTATTHSRGIGEMSQECCQFGESKQAEHERLLGHFASVESTSASAVYITYQMEHRLETIVPGYQQTPRGPEARLLPSHNQLLDDLRRLLLPLGERYVLLLDASEQRLHSPGLDFLSQAAHSMRDLFDEIVHLLAPSQAVRQQPWFVETPEAPDGVSRRSRIRYMLYGSGATTEQEALAQLDELAAGAKTSMDLIIARAHDHDPSVGETMVEQAIDHARFALVRVLEERARRASGF